MPVADLEAALAFLREPSVVPARVPIAGEEPCVQLLDVGREPFQGAFFEDCVGDALTRAGANARRLAAPLAIFDEDLAFERAVPLTGIVFHVSRCGSTIPVRVCQSDPTTAVVSEADPVDVVMTRLPYTRAARVQVLRRVVAAYARDRTGSTERLVLKLDAWHLALHDLVREAFPGVPSVVIVRDPLEVAASHSARRGSHMVPGLLPPELLDIQPSEYEPYDLARYSCLVLRSLYTHAAAACQAGAVLLRYEDMPDVVFDTLVPAFRVRRSDALRESTAWLAGQHAKWPDVQFAADGARKRSAASEELRELVDRLARPAYDALPGG